MRPLDSEKSVWQSPWFWGIGGCCLGCVVLPLAFVAIFGVGMFAVFSQGSGVIDEVLEEVRAHPAAVEALGEPIERGGLFDGQFNVSISNGETELSMPVSGPRGKGRLEVQGRKQGDRWEFEVLTLELDDGRSIDLLAGWST